MDTFKGLLQYKDKYNLQDDKTFHCLFSLQAIIATATTRTPSAGGPAKA
jgi:hypothetical protein